MKAEARTNTEVAHARLLVDDIVHSLGLDLDGMVLTTEMATADCVLSPSEQEAVVGALRDPIQALE